MSLEATTCSAIQKAYSDKATQTDTPALSTLSIESTSVAQSNPANNSVVSPAHATSLTHCTAAYVYSEGQASTATPEKKSPLLSRERYAQLHFNQPSNVKSFAKRVVSLPEDYADTLESNKPIQRVFSLPQRLMSLSPDTSGSSSSADIGSISFDSNSLDLVKQLGTRKHANPHSDLPSTPSPPSSPESIMIIGNNSQVPRTLLRPKYAYNQVCSDDGGWISWTDSPPRPIPALHGPLSLPYARCPSGAEGTIIDGEDLTNMIWGLNRDETHSRSRGPAGAGSRGQYVPPRPQNSPKAHASSIYLNDGPIDLSQLAVLHHQGVSEVSAFVEKPSEKTFLARTHSPNITRPQVQEITAIEPLAWHRGLGLNWQDPIELPPPKRTVGYEDREFSTLKASARPFVPSSPSSPHVLTHMAVEPSFSGFALTGQTRVSVTYPPTPGSSSPLWSPYVTTPAGMDMMSPQIIQSNLPEDQQLLLSQFFSPDLLRRESAQDHYYWAATGQLESETALELTSFDGVSAFSALRTPPLINVIESDTFTKDDKGASTNKRLNTIPTEPALSQGINRSVPALLERRFRGISQQPRSIPLARLIQRRLSSVAEEDVNALIEDYDGSLSGPRSVSPDTKAAEGKSIAPAAKAVKKVSVRENSKLEPRTHQEPLYAHAAVTNDQATKKAVVKLPIGLATPVQRLAIGNEEKNNVKKKSRNRKSRCLSSPPNPT